MALVRFLYCDNAGMVRGKAVTAPAFAAYVQSGVGCTVHQQALTITDEPVHVPGMGPVGEFRLVPDPDTFIELPYAGKSAGMMCDLRTPTGDPWGACPRTFLKRMVDRLQVHHMQAQAGIEHEFYLARKVGENYARADENPLFGMRGLDEHAEFLETLVTTLLRAGIVPLLLYGEYAGGQMELSMHPEPIVRTADNICLLREVTRGVAAKAGLVASFAPKPFTDTFAGSGAHLHVSLWNTAGGGEQAGRNLLYDAEAQGSLSALGRAFIAGILMHLSGLVALTCGSVNSYARLQPGTWSSAYACWGFDNREAAVRVPSTLLGREEGSMNLELRCADHSGNPYLALGGIIAAGLDGVERDLDAGEPLSEVPDDLSEQDRERRRIVRLPTSLEDALDALEADSVLMEALGPMLSTSYLTVKRAEVASFKEKSPEEIAQAHFLKY